MAKYTNIGTVPRTVRGITVKPGETKELKGFANDRCLVRFNEPKPAGKRSKKKGLDKADVPAKLDIPADPQLQNKKDDKQASNNG